MSKRSYTGESRTTKWRRVQEKWCNEERGTCGFHETDDSDGSCSCEFHEAAKSLDFSCEHHTAGTMGTPPSSSEADSSTSTSTETIWTDNSNMELHTDEEELQSAVHLENGRVRMVQDFSQPQLSLCQDDDQIQIEHQECAGITQICHLEIGPREGEDSMSGADDSVEEIPLHDACESSAQSSDGSYSDSASSSSSSDSDTDNSEDGGGDGADGGGDDGGRDNGGDGDDGGGDGDDGGGDGDDRGENGNADNNPEIFGPNFNLDNPLLNRLFTAADGVTAREVLALILATAVRHRLDYLTIVAICRIFNVSSDISVLPATKEQLWSLLNKNGAGIVRHAYCSSCKGYLGPLDNLPRRNVHCQHCNERCQRRQLKYFITLSLRMQLQRLLSIPGIWDYLQYRNTRQKINEEALEDLLDGEGYHNLQQMEGGLLLPFDFSYQVNTDGFSNSKSSNSEAYPVFIRLNEIVPGLRQKTTLLAGVFIDEEEPDFNLFLDAFVTEANTLSEQGIRWNPDGNQEVVSRFFITCFCLDARARASVLNATMYNGRYGCSFCEHPGIQLGSMKYPMPGTLIRRQRRNGEVYNVRIPQNIPIRTDASIRQNMEQAEPGNRVRGLIGPSIVAAINFFDLGHGFSPDDLHPIYIGVTKFMTGLIIENVQNIPAFERAIDRLLLQIRTPTLISRKPRSIRRRKKWKGTEWRNWLLYYAVPILRNLNNFVGNAVVTHIGLLSKAVFLLSQDSVSEDDIDEAERCLIQFTNTFQEVYGPENMRFNVHVLLHLPSAVRRWSALQNHSTMPSESLNKRLKDHIHSPKGAPDQIVGRFLLVSLVNMLLLNNELSDEVRAEMQFIMYGNRQEGERIGNVTVFGDGEIRVPSEEEVELLRAENLQCDQLTEYLQCKKSNILFRSANYDEDEEFKSNNSYCYSTDDRFFHIDSIVTFQTRDELVCGMFCHHFRTGAALNGVNHIMEVTHMDERVFVRASLLRKPAIRIQSGNRVYVLPMSNCGEID